MTGTARDVMQSQPAVASPSWTLAELERHLIQERCGGFPVVRDGALVGVVSRSDLVQKSAVERSREGTFSDFYCEFGAAAGRDPQAISRDENQRVAERLAALRVADVMSPPTFVAQAATPIAEVARMLVEHHIHRVPVVEKEHLVGIVSSLDLVALLVPRADNAPPDEATEL